MSTQTTVTGTNLPVQDLQAIVTSMRAANAPDTAGESWNDAAVTGSFSFSAGGGNLEGWITFYDGTKVHYKLTGITSKTGSAAGVIAVPLVRFKPASEFAGKAGRFEVSGFMFGGNLYLYCNGVPITQAAISVASAAPWDYEMIGTVQYTLG
jgi:hypothetical protein